MSTDCQRSSEFHFLLEVHMRLLFVISVIIIAHGLIGLDVVAFSAVFADYFE